MKLGGRVLKLEQLGKLRWNIDKFPNREKCSISYIQILNFPLPIFRSSHLPLKRLNQSPNVLLDLNLIDGNCRQFIRLLSNRWQVVPFHMRSLRIVILREFIRQIVEMLLAKHNELVEAFQFDCLNKQLSMTIQVR